MRLCLIDAIGERNKTLSVILSSDVLRGQVMISTSESYEFRSLMKYFGEAELRLLEGPLSREVSLPGDCENGAMKS